MKKPLHETIEAQLISTASSINVDNIFQLWSGKKYGALAVLLAALRATYIIHQQHHWQSTGQNYYADHLLFQRLYETTLKNVDDVAERCVGVGDANTVDIALQVKTMWLFIKDNLASNVMSRSTLVQRSINMEFMLLTIAEHVKEYLRSNTQLTAGIDNLIAGIQDIHESHVYLLKQRLEP